MGLGFRKGLCPQPDTQLAPLAVEHQRAELALGKHFCSNLISNGRLAPSSSLYSEQCFFQGSQILAENPDPADSPEACGEWARGGKIGAGKGRYVVTNSKPTASNAAAFTWGRKEALPREFSTGGALLEASIRVFPVKNGGPIAMHLCQGQGDPGPLWPRVTPSISLHCTRCAESITWHEPAGENRDQLEH